MMHYSQSLRYLNAFLNLERITFRPNSRLWNLERMKYLLDLFGHPEKDFFPLLIAGTKGKGSTGFFLESILKKSGLRTGFYSSPHLEDPRERIRFGGRIISKRDWAGLVSRIQNMLNDCHSGRPKADPESRTMDSRLSAINRGRIRLLCGGKPCGNDKKALEEFTYFEILTLMAVLYFQSKKAEVGIFEVGMGGRLDATNVLAPRLALLTPIHLDHEAILGNTIRQIAREKAAIIRRGAYVVTGPQPREALAEIKTRAKKMKAFLLKAPPAHFEVGLKGDFQRLNAGVAARAALVLRDIFGFSARNRGGSAKKYGGKISPAAVRNALKPKAIWPGRFEIFKGSPSFLLDAAHNPASTRALVRNLRLLYPKRESLLVFSTSRDKKSDQMLQILSTFFSRIILLPNPTPRTQEIHTLLLQSRDFFKEIFPVGNAGEAVALARKLAPAQALVTVTGSFYLLGEVRKILRHA